MKYSTLTCHREASINSIGYIRRSNFVAIPQLSNVVVGGTPKSSLTSNWLV